VGGEKAEEPWKRQTYNLFNTIDVLWQNLPYSKLRIHSIRYFFDNNVK
jgi:hypothetical protein